MHIVFASRIMRTTIDIDDPILKDLKRLQAREGKSLGRLVSDLLAVALSQTREDPPPYTAFDWQSADMGALVDPSDRDALLDAMDEAHRGNDNHDSNDDEDSTRKAAR